MVLHLWEVSINVANGSVLRTSFAAGGPTRSIASTGYDLPLQEIYMQRCIN
jgi:hypothetical protein